MQSIHLNAVVLERTQRVRTRIMANEPAACYHERETALAHFAGATEKHSGQTCLARAVEFLLSEMTPLVRGDDVLLGLPRERVVPGIAGSPHGDSNGFEWRRDLSWFTGCPGHMTLDYPTLLAKGFSGILSDLERTAAERPGDDKARLFFENAAICVAAIGAFAKRHAAAAAELAPTLPIAARRNLSRAAESLALVPCYPARDFFSACQSVWFTHFLFSCCLGGRDFAWGRLDQILWPYYQRDLSDGRLSVEEVLAIIVDFFLKANEIAGPNSPGRDSKPIPCQGTKQYLVLGGRGADGRDQANDLSCLFLEALRIVDLREPVVNVRFHPDCNSPFQRFAVETAVALGGRIQFLNDKFIPGSLIRRGVAEVDAFEYTAVGCSRIEIGGAHDCHDRFVWPIHWLMEFLADRGDRHQSMAALLADFRQDVRRRIAGMAENFYRETEPFWDLGFINDGGPHFHLESLLTKDCVAQGRQLCDGGARYVFHHLTFGGLATAADTLTTIERLVFRERRLKLSELLTIAGANFIGHEPLRQEILTKIPKFGNDHGDADANAVQLAHILADAIDTIKPPSGHLLYGAFASWTGHIDAGSQTGATLDGRRAGEPLSENQSPSLGADVHGLTALLNSVANLPFDRVCSGSLNLKLVPQIPPDNLHALVRVFFSRGGSILGITLVDNAILEDAMANPEKYPTLQIRLHGYSEYFVKLSPSLQRELVERTRHP